MNKTSVKRPGAGRTVGSTSFITLPISALCGKFADMNTEVKVSRLWAQSMGLHGEQAPSGAEIKKTIKMPNPNKVEPVVFNKIDFEEKEGVEPIETPAILEHQNQSEEKPSDLIEA